MVLLVQVPSIQPYDVQAPTLPGGSTAGTQSYAEQQAAQRSPQQSSPRALHVLVCTQRFFTQLSCVHGLLSSQSASRTHSTQPPASGTQRNPGLHLLSAG